MKKNMSWIGMLAIFCLLVISVSNLMKQGRGTRQMEGVQAYMAQRYPDEQFTYSGAQVGGRGAYSIVSPVGEPDATFRVFAGRGKSGEAFEDTYYTLTLRKEVRTEAEKLVHRVFPTACVLPKIYQLSEGEVLRPYPTLEEYCARNGANIDMWIVVDDSQGALLTQEHVEQALKELSESFVCETVVFSVAKPGKMDEISGLSFAGAEKGKKELFTQSMEARISAPGSWQMR